MGWLVKHGFLSLFQPFGNSRMDSVMHPIQSSFKYNKVVENANLQEYHVSGMEAIKKNGKYKIYYVFN